MATVTDVQICEQYRITPDELDRATRLTDGEGKVFYQVTSRSGGDDHQVRWNGHRLTCTCAAGRENIPCWAQRAALAANQLHKIAIAAEKRAAFQREQAAAEAAEAYRAEQAAAALAAAQAILAEEAEKRARMPLTTNNDGFSLAKREPTRVKGYDIRIQRAGSTWMNEKAHGFAPEGQLPTEWAQICADPSVVKAVLFPSAQRNWQAQKRKNVATYERAAVAVA